jgi:coenzyme Q-binding protein COQ10
MPSFRTSRNVGHSARDMFALVSDVERYPEFVPLCQSLRLLRREKTEDGEALIARMTIAYKFFKESFTSRVRLRPAASEILVEYLDGPFRRLENRWTFAAVGETACLVGFSLDYEFKTKAMQTLMGAVFDRAFRTFADAFEARADTIYSSRTAAHVANDHPTEP